MRKTFASIALTCIALLGVTACDAPTESTTLDLDFTCDPNPVNAVESQGVTYEIVKADSTIETREYDWLASFTVHIQEKGGMDLTMTAVNLKVEQASGGIVITTSGGEIEHYKYNFLASDNQLPANGSTSVGLNTWYDLPNNGREALVTVSFSFKDENEYIYNDSEQCRIAP